MTETTESAFILRISLDGGRSLEEALASDQLIIGWSKAEGLLRPEFDWESFRDVVRQAYHADDLNLRRAGNAAGHLWRFIHDMKVGDLVVVPSASEFFVGKVAGPATFDRNKVAADTAYRRNVIWLNEKRPIPRTYAKLPLISRMKSQGTCTEARDLIDEIKECLVRFQSGSSPTFTGSLTAGIKALVTNEMRVGYLDNFGFEKLIERVLLGMGALHTRIIPRNQDKGVDLIATFRVAGVFDQVIAVQAKQWDDREAVGSEVVDQLARGMEVEAAHMGVVVTSGMIGESALRRAQELKAEKGYRVELIDGETFSRFVVEYGLRGDWQN